jgi:DNA-binding transcriptional LysR family regulator
MSADEWLGIDLRHLAALEAVARTRSFGGAARELGYTQSAVSQQIAQLERIVGQKLFDRPGGPRRVEPTEAGLLLLGHADAIVAQLDAARADMAALAEGAAGTLRVGIYQSVGARLLPALVRRFRAQWPQVGVRVREESSAEDLLRLVEHGELDLTFADLPLREGPFEWAELLQDPYVLLVSARSELAELDSAP